MIPLLQVMMNVYEREEQCINALHGLEVLRLKWQDVSNGWVEMILFYLDNKSRRIIGQMAFFLNAYSMFVHIWSCGRVCFGGMTVQKYVYLG